MKHVKLLLAMAWLVVSFVSCEKDISQEPVAARKASFTLDGLTNAVWEGSCDQPYNIVLYNIVDLGGGKYQWQWGIANLYGAPDLSRISFEIPDWVKVESPEYAFPGQLQQPAKIVLNDRSYARCKNNTSPRKKDISFLIPTVGQDVTYFYLTVNTNIVEEQKAYFQNAGGCGTTCFPGIGDTKADEDCSFNQGRFFASPRKWPSPGTVTIGGHTYTESEGRSIWKSRNRGGISDAKKAFHQVATIKLSAASISASASVWADVKIVEDWLARLPKLTPHNHYKYASRKAKAAAKRIDDWIDENKCK